MLEISSINVFFLIIITIALIGFFILTSLMLVSTKRIQKKPLPYLSLIISLTMFAMWVYYTFIYLFLKNTSITRTVIPEILIIFIIIASFIVFSTPYVVPKIKKMMALYYLVMYFGTLLIGYIISNLVESPQQPILTFFVEKGALKISFERFFVIGLSLWSVSAIVLLLCSSTPWKKIKEPVFISKKAYYFYRIGVTAIATGFSIFLLDIILRLVMKLNWFNALIFGLSRSLILIGIDIIVFSAIIDLSVLSPMLRLIAFYIDAKKISTLVSIFSEKGPDILYIYGVPSLKALPKEKREMELYTYIINTMSVFGMGTKFIEGSAFFPVPFEKDSTCLGITKWFNDKVQQEPRFNGKTFLQVHIVVPKHIDHLITNRDLWEKELATLLANVSSRKQIQNEKLWINFVLKTLSYEAMRKKT